MLNDTELGINSMNEALSTAQTRQMELQAEQEIMSSELETIRAKLQARNDKPPPPAAKPGRNRRETGQQPGDLPFPRSED